MEKKYTNITKNLRIVIDKLGKANDLKEISHTATDLTAKQLGYKNAALFINNEGTLLFSSFTTGKFNKQINKIVNKYSGQNQLNIKRNPNLITDAAKTKSAKQTTSVEKVLTPAVPVYVAKGIQKLLKVNKIYIQPCINQRSLEAVLLIGGTKATDFDEDTLDLLGRYIGNTLYAQKQKEQDLLDAMLVIEEIVKVIERTKDEIQLTKSIVNLIVHDLGYLSAVFMPPEGTPLEYAFKHTHSIQDYIKIKPNLYKYFKGRDIVESKNLINEAVDKREILYSSDITEVLTPPFPAEIARKAQNHIGFKDGAIIPLSSKDSLEGIILIGDNSKFTKTEKEIFRLLQREVTYALQNKRYYMQLAQENKDFMRILENIYEGVFIYKDQKFEYISPQLSEITEYSTMELYNIEKVSNIISQKEHDRIQEIMKRRRKGLKAPRHYRSQIVSKSGRIVDVEVRTTPIRFKNQNMFMVALRDISKELKNAEKTQKVQKRQAELFSEIAHSLKTPFTIINGKLELMINDGLVKDSSCYNTAIELKQELKEVNTKVTKLLDVAKLDLKDYKLSIKPTSFREFFVAFYIKAKALGYKYCTPEHNVNCKCLTAKNSTNPIINIDKDAFMDVLMTIIENAYIHSPKKNETPHIEIGVNEMPYSIQIIIQDYGKGIPKKYQEELFEPFSAIHRTNTGHGIGLPMCKKIIEEHGGCIELESEKEKGTKVVITLPR